MQGNQQSLSLWEDTESSSYKWGLYAGLFFFGKYQNKAIFKIVCISSFLHTNIDLTEIIFQEMLPKQLQLM